MTAYAVGISEVNARVVAGVEEVIDELNSSIREHGFQRYFVSSLSRSLDCLGHDVSFGLTHSEGADVIICRRAGSRTGNLSDDDRQSD